MWQSLIDRTREETEDMADDNKLERKNFLISSIQAQITGSRFRTALTYNQNINFNTPFDVFTHTQQLFLFEKLFDRVT